MTGAEVTDPGLGLGIARSALLGFCESLKQGGLILIGAPNPKSLSGVVTKYSPHWFHVWFYRHVRGDKNAGLPGEAGELAYAIAKENFYFVYPNKFQYFVTQYKGRMVSGGLSMEEMIVPLATLTPK